MPHFFVDDSFSDSKEVLSIPTKYRTAAVGLWTLAGSWSAGKLTDGHVPDEVVKRFAPRSPGVIQMLIDSTLWERTETGIRFTNWGKWQRTRQQVVEYRAWDAERKRKRRAVVEQVSRSRNTSSPDDEPDSSQLPPTHNTPTSENDETSPRDSDRDSRSCPQGSPRTPIPIPKRTTTQVPTEVTLSGGSGGRGSRLPDDWNPPADVIAQMRADHPHVNLKAEHEKFCDYWHAKAGKDATKRDWAATWRNWIRRAAEQQPTRTAAVNGKPHKLRVAAELVQRLRAEENAQLANQPRKEINP